MGLCAYVRTKLSSNPSLLIRKEGAPYLAFALLPRGGEALPGREAAKFTRGIAPIEMVTFLLEHGASPNELWNGFTPWEQVLFSMHSQNWGDSNSKSVRQIPDKALLDSWGQNFRVLLQNGTNPEATCWKPHRLPSHTPISSGHTVLDIITEVFDNYSPLDGAEIRQVWMEQIDPKKSSTSQRKSTLSQPTANSELFILNRKRHNESDEETSRKRAC